MQLARASVGNELDENALDFQRHHDVNGSKGLGDKHRGNRRQEVLALQYQHLQHVLQLLLKKKALKDSGTAQRRALRKQFVFLSSEYKW